MIRTPHHEPDISDSPSLQPALLRWNERHATVMIVVAAATAAAGLPLWLLLACAALSFARLLHRCRNRWTPAGRFGPANAVTLARLAALVALPFLPPVQVALVGATLLALDGVDGWVARRTGCNGEFGEFFDKESDACFMLVLCLLLYRVPGGFGAWILLPGSMRYLFVLFVKFARPPMPKEQRTRQAGWIFLLMMSALLLSFAAHPGYLDHARPVAAAMTVVLAFSFARSLERMYRAARRSVET